MTGEGIVVKSNGNTATGKIKRSSACGHDCGECNLCKNPDIEVDILNPINAKKRKLYTVHVYDVKMKGI